MTYIIRLLILICVAVLFNQTTGRGQELAVSPTNSVSSGILHIERPTLICLGFEWRITGDDNLNAACSVRYRKAGTEVWKESLPLYRTGKGRTADYGFGNFNDPNHAMRYTIPEAFAGSILDMEPDTEYDVLLTLTDPDGITGEQTKRMTLWTRAAPAPAPGGEVRHVYPTNYKGPKEEPAYLSIMHAVNGFHPWCDNYQTVHPNRARPGTVIKVHAGLYKADRRDYRDAGGLWQHGTHTLVADGAPGQPIAIVAAGDGEVIIDGDDCDVLFNMMAADYLYFEGLTIRNTRIAFHGGFQGVLGCKGLTMKHCRLESISYGVLAQDGRSEDFYIADNVFIGKNPGDRFNPESGGAFGKSKAGYAVNLAGQGHVVCYNRLENFWDGLNVFTNSLADPALGQQSRAIDFYNNDIFNSTDNFIESDGGYANIRILRNRCFNVMAAPISVQPVYAGPVYWIRNVVFNAHWGVEAMKMVDGDNVIFLHNTSTCHWTNGQGCDYGDVRNNLFMGPTRHLKQQSVDRNTAVLEIGMSDPRSMLDYNGYRIGLPVTYPFRFTIGDRSGRYDSLADMSADSGYERHGLEITDYTIFQAADEPEHVTGNTSRLYHPVEVDLRPRTGSAIIDAACVIAGVNDNFTGAAPDMGAYEYGQSVPYYGPRD